MNVQQVPSTDFGKLVARHRAYFLTGKTRPVDWREAQLTALAAMITDNAKDFHAALWTDLRRNWIEADLIDVATVAHEADYARQQLKTWMRPVVTNVPQMMQPGEVRVRFDPLGVGLIIGAWNYPFFLTLSPLIGAIAGGNAAVIKPSEIAPACADVLAKLFPRYMDKDAFSVVLGAVPETTALLEQKWDHIFYTGGPAVGKIVMAAAAKHLTPVVLELGGKCPTIVHSSANLAVAANRIAQGRWLNAGQTCTGVDHVLVFKDVKEQFLSLLKDSVIQFYGKDPSRSPDYGRMVSERHHARIVGLLKSGEVFLGGQHDSKDRYIAPTILVNTPLDSPVMQEEIFGPILPVLEVGSVEEVINYVNARPKPLGLYVFAEDLEVAERILGATESGDAGINDCTIHPLVPELPFGGVGNSGMGKYHGEWGFRAYTNARGVLYRGTAEDPGVRYPPYPSKPGT
ncbi:aldehyde dehydrogenase family protein [Variovorax sp. J31P179]|uniref:aldehyde dehydrogenase family protein n=1 Tax=Variovorax sp. J31P179 TaxID=3053508 RepID=UPI0025776874|nr:aldehyde dehydrogenase family protein [Variovorax sp. J31P179]MDM0082880.1 aldehyde dehydrogenase family protein [Variovorax sp. J31P179]